MYLRRFLPVPRFLSSQKLTEGCQMLRGDAFGQELKSQRSLFRVSPWSSLACILLPFLSSSFFFKVLFFFLKQQETGTGSQKVKNSKTDGPTKSLLGQKQYAWQENKKPIYEQQRPTHSPHLRHQHSLLAPRGSTWLPLRSGELEGPTGRGTHLSLILLSQALLQEPRGQRQTN